MATPDVFRPSNGPLLVRDAGMYGSKEDPLDKYRKQSPAGRPTTQSGYRFGQLSHNSFFTRHNPHPHRVRHIKGLLDIPICAVNDNGYFSSARYSLMGVFPPNEYDTNKLRGSRYSIPVNAINVNSQLHPINTITGLQFFTGLNSYPFREKAVPGVGMVPVTETWRDELRQLTEAAGLNLPVKKEETEEKRPRTSVYSSETGRLLPPPSRAMTRQGSRAGKRQQLMQQVEHITGEPDVENMVFSMLCQILQTEDINAVQSWLVSAGEREKTLVLDMIKSAMVSKDDYYNRWYNAEYVEPDANRSQSAPPGTPGLAHAEQGVQTGASLGGSAQVEKRIDRLSLDGDGHERVEVNIQVPDVQDRNWTANYSWTPERETGKVPMLPKINEDCKTDLSKPPKTPAFRVKNSPRYSPRKSPCELAPLPKSPRIPENKPSTPLAEGPKLRYSTPTKEQMEAASMRSSVLKNLVADQQKTWQPDKSVV